MESEKPKKRKRIIVKPRPAYSSNGIGKRSILINEKDVSKK